MNPVQFLILQTNLHPQFVQHYTEQTFKAVNQILGDFCTKFRDLYVNLFNIPVPAKQTDDDTQISKQKSSWQNLEE